MERQKSRGTGTSAIKRVGSRRSWQGVALVLRSKEGGGWGKRSLKKVSLAQVRLLEGSIGERRPPSQRAGLSPWGLSRRRGA